MQSTNTHPPEKTPDPTISVLSSESGSRFSERKTFLSVQQSARIIAQLILEITWGKRPMHHIKPWIDPGRYDLLSEKIDTILKLRQSLSFTANYAPTIKILRILPISNNIFEISVVAQSNSRFRAVALRLERKNSPIKKLSENTFNVWATAIELG